MFISIVIYKVNLTFILHLYTHPNLNSYLYLDGHLNLNLHSPPYFASYPNLLVILIIILIYTFPKPNLRIINNIHKTIQHKIKNLDI